MQQTLYALTRRDSEVTPLDVLYKSLNSIGGPASHLFLVPADKILLLQSINAKAEGGGANLPVRLQVTVTKPGAGGGTFDVAELMHIAAATGATNEPDFQRSLQFNDLPIYPTFGILFRYTYDGGVLNDSTSSIAGILIPRGNFSLGDI